MIRLTMLEQQESYTSSPSAVLCGDLTTLYMSMLLSQSIAQRENFVAWALQSPQI